MKNIKYIVALFTCMVVGIGVLYSQRVYTVDDVPNTRLGGYGNSVSNPDGTLSAGAVEQINRKLATLQQQTSIEIAVVVIESVGDVVVEDFGIQLFRKWGIGKKDKNNGLLILLVTGDRIVRFETGYGLEGVMTDAVSKRIQTQRMMPFLKANDWDGATISAVDASIEYLTAPDSDLGNEVERRDEGSTGTWLSLLFILGMMALLIIISIMMWRKQMKCPRCGTQMKVVDSTTSQINRTTSVTQTTLRCPKCGYTTTRSTTQSIGSAIGGAIGGGMIGGFGRGGGRGFSGGGGSWGGGSAGGGGASTRF